jgi:UDP-N-acetylmuramate dehydrogenase
MSEPARPIPLMPRHRSAVVSGVSLARYTSLRVGGPARSFLESDDAARIAEEIQQAARNRSPVLVLGGGSNLLVADDGFDGLAVKYSADGAEVEAGAAGAGIVSAAAGTAFANLARRLARDGWAGLEWGSNVPGTIGGAAVNNAGAFGKSMTDDVVDLDCLDLEGRSRTLTPDELQYAYRSSVLKRGMLGPVLVTRVRCRVYRDDPTDVRARIAEMQARRTATQPRQNSAGSVFANPPGDFAGRLIEAAGLKGAQVGGARISPQHANFIVNEGEARAADVYSLVRLAQDTVWRQLGVWLKPEIQLVGSWPRDQLRALARPEDRP